MTKASTCCDAGRLPEGDDDLIDFHTHILPRIDDGSGSSQESLELLALEKEQGVDRIVFTPHFYAGKDSVENFLDRREKSYQRLLFRMEEKSIEPPVFYKGAEVYYFTGMGKAEMVLELCIEGTNILLLEMPFAQWDKGVVEDVKFLVQKRKLTLIIAHIERYYPFQKDKKYWEAVFDLPVYTQINTESFLSWRTRHRALGFLKSGDHEVILGSDCHNMKTRLPNLQEGRNVIACKLGAQYLQEIDALGERILP